MKKLFTITLWLVTAICALTFSGCGNSYFNGNYSQTSKEDVIAYADDLSSSSNDINYIDGYKLEIELDVSMNEGDAFFTDVETEIMLKLVNVEDSLQMQGEIDMDMSTDGVKTGISGDVYLKDGWLYTDGKLTANGTSVTTKTKQQTNVDDFIDDMLAGFDYLINVDIFDALDLDEVYDCDIEIYWEKTTEETKIKIVVPKNTYSIEEYGEVYAGNISGEFYFIYDSNNKLTAMMFEMESTQTTSQDGVLLSAIEYEIKYSITPYSQSISMPSNLDSYLPTYL